MEKTKDNFNKVLISIAKFNTPAFSSAKIPVLWKMRRHFRHYIRRYRCAQCNRVFSIKTGTIFNNSKLPFKKLFRLIYLLVSTDLEQKVIAKRCCINVSTVVRFNTMIKELK